MNGSIPGKGEGIGTALGGVVGNSQLLDSTARPREKDARRCIEPTFRLRHSAAGGRMTSAPVAPPHRSPRVPMMLRAAARFLAILALVCIPAVRADEPKAKTL